MSNATEEKNTEELINVAVKAAIKEYRNEEKNEKKKKALHNTKLLLKNYDKIKISIEEAISEADQLDQDIIDYTDEEEVYINSIRKSKLKSLIVISHIDKALTVIEEEQKRNGTPEKYEAFVYCFIQGMNYETAAELIGSSKSAIGRWVNEITRDISIQLFGVDGLTLV